MNLNRLVPAKGGNGKYQKRSLCRSVFFMASFAEKLRRSVVGIAGLGGLGSNVAVALARSGVGKLIIADFDNVEQSNLNRQHYFADQLGISKVDCMVENLRRINTSVEVVGHKVTLNAGNIPQIFSDADCIAECFDAATAKQMFVETVLVKMGGVKIVSVSGLGGYGKSNEIKTKRVSPRLVMVGDGLTAIDNCKILTAARVGLAAMHQANAIIELLVDEIQP
jgi:sulfur carrier protein ThiS adenylyltransferase